MMSSGVASPPDHNKVSLTCYHYFHLLKNRSFGCAFKLAFIGAQVSWRILLVPTFSKILAKLFKNRATAAGNLVVKQSTTSFSVVKSQGKSPK
jgi:hypothetical protein